MVKDIPIPDNQSIIIFSATGGGEGGRVRQNITFSALTAITLSGGVETDFVRVTPSGSGFSAVAKAHKAAGQTTFSVTATTAGDEENGIEGMTVSFTFRVLVIGIDMPTLLQSFFEFQVGAAVGETIPLFFAAQQAQLNIPKVPSAITSATYGDLEEYYDTEHGGIGRVRWTGEPSGISLDPILDEYNYVRGVALTGMALRPGIYYRVFEISSYDDGGGLDPFPGSTGYGIVIINIYDDRQSPKIVVPFDYHPDDNALRVIRHGVSGYIAERLTGEFFRSGDDWTRVVSEPVGEGVSDVWQYQMVRDAGTGVWTLSGRNYLSDETAPVYSTLAVASSVYSGEIPPNTGWSNNVLAAGGAHYYVDGFGFFDRKGEREIELEGAEEPFVGDVYQQQPIAAAQYAGWTNPPATRFDAGLYLAQSPDGKWRISIDALSIDGEKVVPRPIKHAAIPYHPPTAVPAIGGVNYRDVALLVQRVDAMPVAVNAHLPTSDNLVLRAGKYVAGVPAHYPWLRQLPPPASASARTESLTFGVTIDQRSNTYSRSREYQAADTGTPSTTYGKVDSETRTQRLFSGSASLAAWLRNGDLVSGVMASYANNLPGSVSYQYNHDYLSESWNTFDVSGTLAGVRKTHTGTLKAITGSDGRFLIVPATGRNEDDDRVRAYCAAFLEASAAFTTDTTKLEEARYPGTGWFTTVDETGTGSDSASFTAVSPAPAKTSLAAFSMPFLATETLSCSFNGRHDVQRWGTYNPAPPSGETYLVDIALTHTHTAYSGDDLPPALISSGMTHHVRTTTVPGVDPVVIDEWLDDPDGDVYAALKAEFLDVNAVEDPGPWPSEEEGGYYNYHFDVFVTSNESYTRQTKSFGS